MRVAIVACVGLVACAVLPGLLIATRCVLTPSQPPSPTQHRTAEEAISGISAYARPGSATYLTLPEWFIVYSTEEYAAWIRRAPPSGFPYVGSILDFWTYYREMCRASCAAFSFDSAHHVMLVVIGSSFTIENVLKGLYENTVGRIVEAIAGHDTEEDLFAAQTADEYGRFMHTTPWYEFPFRLKLTDLWRQTHAWGRHPLRKWERRLALSAEYATKAAYGWLIRVATKSAYGNESLQTFVRADHVPADLSGLHVERVRTLRDGSEVLALQRYEAFTPTVSALVARNVRLLDIAGNGRVLMTVVAPTETQWTDGLARVLFSRRLATDRKHMRVAIDVEVGELGPALNDLSRRGAALEHIYDY